jgi:imidazolonepropionase-like amidohydrolase
MSRKNLFQLFSLIVFLGFISLPPALSANNNLLIKAKRIYTVTQGIIEDGMILIENGKISKAGKEFPIPKNVKEIKANVVIPGLIDIHTHLGVYSLPMVEENSDGNEMTNPITPQVRALDSFNFEDPAIKVGLAGGVTTIVSRPGSGNVIGGTSVAVKLKNAPPEEMILKEVCDLKMAIEGNPVGVYGAKKQMPSTLMAVYFLARKAFIEAQEYQKSWETYEKDKKEGKDVNPPKRDLGKEVLVKALKREIPVHIHCATASEIMTCIRLADEFNLKISLGHCYWAYLIVEELARRKDVYLNVGPPMFFDYYENPLSFKNCPAILANAGIKVSLQTDAIGGGQQNLRELASLCVRFGMKEEDALKAITIWEAEAVGLEKRIGSLEAGKDADLVLLDGEPFEFFTSVDEVIIDGKVEYQKEKSESVNIQTAVPQAKGNLTIPSDLKNSSQFALKGGTILTMAGNPLKEAVILVKDGKIEQIGGEILIPKGCPVIDAKDFFIMPGLISPRSYIGISANWRQQSSIDEISKPIVPEMEIKHAIEPQAPLFLFARELGITTILVSPGNKNVMGGQGAVVKTVGDVVDKMIAKDKAIMVFGFGASAKRSGQMPSTRMGVAALLRETLVKAQEYRDKVEKYEKDKKGTAPQRDFSLEALISVLKGEMPVLVHAEREDDILTALRIADEFKLKIILDGATDAYKVVDEIKKREIPVILESLFRGAGNIEDKGFNPRNPTILAKAGIRVAFRAQEGFGWYAPGAGSAGGDLLEIAAFAVKNGMPEDAALRAITIDAAKIIGLEARVGSLEQGKDADIVILRGHPFLTGSVPEAVFISGKLVYQRAEAARF